MMEFLKYQHVERFGTDEVDGIEFGKCYVFPKIDGTNGQIWADGESIRFGSRNRELCLENDNQGFMISIIRNEMFRHFFNKFPDTRLYGEWLVPHSLKTYKKTAWRKFYVFDVMVNDKYIKYDTYKRWLDDYEIEYIPCIATVENGNIETFNKILEKNNYLIEDGKGTGEGIVIKNYEYVNKYGRTTWAKIVTSEFKEKHVKAMGAPEIKGTYENEDRFINDFCTETFIKKEYAKLSVDGWNSKMIPKLLGVIFNQLITENIWQAIKEYKYPVLDFSRILKLCNQKVKVTLKEIF